MRPAQAIKTCLSKSFQVSGRASRSEYWWFLPFGLALPVVGLLLLRTLWPDSAFTIHLAMASVLLLPQVAVTARRLTDTGEPASDIHTPLGAYVVFLGALCLARFSFAGFDRMIEQAGSPGGFMIGLVLAPIMLAMLGLVAGVFLFGLFSGASLFGQMAVASQPNVSNPGPNPLEVTP
jgi:uncharacterized membrane protein YhaH (DUF805 family)